MLQGASLHMNNGCIMQNRKRNCKIILIWKNFWMSVPSDCLTVWHIQTGNSHLSILESNKAWFLFMFGEKKLSSFISFHLTFQFMFLDQTRQVCKFVELAFKSIDNIQPWHFQPLNNKVHSVSDTRQISTNSGKACQTHSHSSFIFYVASPQLRLASG